jgi:hypothetical protein
MGLTELLTRDSSTFYNLMFVITKIFGVPDKELTESSLC